MNAARHLMSDARNNAEWPPVAKKMPKINPFVFWCQIDYSVLHPNLTKSCLFLWSVTDVRLQGSDLEIVVLRIFAIMAPMLSVE